MMAFTSTSCQKNRSGSSNLYSFQTTAAYVWCFRILRSQNPLSVACKRTDRTLRFSEARSIDLRG
jgi:hypothetical protein